MQRTRRRIIACEGDERRAGGVDEVGGEQRRSVSFIAHSRPLREGLTSQGLRGSGQANSLPRYLLQVKTTTHRRPPWPAAPNAVKALCAMSSTPVTHSHRVTRRHVRQWLRPSPCSLMRDGWMRSVYQSILHSVVPTMRDQHPFAINLETRSTSTRLHLHPSHTAPPPPTTPHTPMPSSVRRVQPRILPPTHHHPRVLL